MRKGNRFLLLLLAALMVAVTVAVAHAQQQGFFAAPTPAPTPTPSPTPAPTPTPVAALRGRLRVTEIMIRNRATLPDEDGDFPDWIELCNVSDAPLSLADCRVSDRAGRAGWPLPDRTLDAGERLLLFASRKNRGGAELHTGFALSEYDCVILTDGLGLEIDRADCRACEADVALALGADGSWAETNYPTPGFENTAEGYARFQESLGAPSPLVIYEAAVKNFGLFVAGSADDCDWVEVRNVSDAAVLLSLYYLSDTLDDPCRWQLPERMLGPGEIALFACAEEGSAYFGSVPCTGFALDSTRDQLYLTRSGGTLADWASLRDIPAGCSYGRMDGRAGFFYFAEPTPGAANRDGKRRVSAMPVNLTPDGVFEGVESVTLALAGAGELRYAVDSGAPTEQSALYTRPLELTESCVVCVKSYEPDALPSRTLGLSFFLNEGHQIPVASFVAEDFRSFSTIYRGGVKLHEQAGTLALYREGDTFRANCGITLNGETSLVLSKKNMAVHFRGAYGADTVEHDLFGGGVTRFHSLLLRAGQDQYQANLRNELAQSLAAQADTNVLNQRSLFCALYLDGQYIGLFALLERPNAAHYAALAGVERDSVEVVEAPASYTSALYRDTVGFVNSHDMSLAESYEAFCRGVDIDSLIDWLFLEGFFANTDLLGGNLRYVRSPQADGRWHLMLYDLDVAFRHFDSIQRNLLNSYAAGNIQAASFSVPLMKNPAFCERFLTRAAELLRGPLSNESVLAELARMEEEIRPEVEWEYRYYGQDIQSWHRAIDNLRAMIRDNDWRQANIDTLCKIFELSAGERARFFGDMDGRSAR